MNDDEESPEQRRNLNNNGSPTNDAFREIFTDDQTIEYRESKRKSQGIFKRFLGICNCFRCSKNESSHRVSENVRVLDTEEGNPPEMDHPLILRGLALAFSRRPLVVLMLTVVIAFSITWIALSEYGLPEFDDPYLGFETRSTSIANRIITLRNLKGEISQLQVLENYPGEKLSGKEWRRRRKRQSFPVLAHDSTNLGLSSFGIHTDEEKDGFEFNNRDLCTSSPLEDYSRVALEIKDPQTIFDFETVMLICFFQKKMEELSSYRMSCEKDAGYACCPGWSLPNYIATYSNKTDCAQLQEVHIRKFKRDLLLCRNFYQLQSSTKENDNDCWKRHGGGKCPQMCLHGGALHSAYMFTLDNRFLVKNESRFTIVVLPVGKSSMNQPVTESLQEELSLISLPKDSVFLAGYDFGGKDNIFKRYLVSDLQFMVFASILIFFVVCIYTKSIFVTIVSFGILTLSLGNAYFIYSAILKVPYFPFMNMLVTIIVMGIGTDGTLILGSHWHRLQLRYLSQRDEKHYWETIMTELLAETTAPLFITTCTTAAAFFASLASSITTIRCFSIFAGTATIMGFILLYFSVPTALILSNLVTNYLKSLLPNESESKGKLYSKILQLSRRLADFFASINVFKKPYVYVKSLIEDHRAKCWLAAFLLLVGILMWANFVVFIHPQFQLPNTEQFQLLSSNHPTERFDRVVEPEFTTGGVSEEDLGDKMTVYFIWGLEGADTGNTLDPMDDGDLVFDHSFSLGPHQNQKWMRRLCGKLKQQPFYDEVANSMVGAHYDSCFLETMIKWMKRDCEHIFFKNVSYAPCCKASRFPYDSEVFSKCVGLASRDMHRTPTSYFRGDVAGPKFFLLRDNRNSNDSESKPTELRKDGQLATFSLRVKTNVTFSLAYEKMDKFYKQLEAFFNEHIQSEKVPVGLENGFFVSAHLDFYDLQTSLLLDTCQSVLLSAGLCFLFLLIFVRKFRVAIGAVICIFAIVIVSSAILISVFNWKLGVFESIAVTVAVGLSDFTAHNAIEFSKRKSVAAMTSPTFFAAVTTITMGLMMLTCSNVLVYQQIGAFFFVLILVSWIYSVFFLSPVLALFDYILTAFRMRRVPKPPSSIFTTGVSYSSSAAIGPHSPSSHNMHFVNNDGPLEGTVYCNAMLTGRTRRKKSGLSRNRAISEPAIQHARNSVHFGRAESTELVDSPTLHRGGVRSTGVAPARTTRSSHNMNASGAPQSMMEQWKLLKKLGTETAV